MMFIKNYLIKKAQKELNFREIEGEVVGVRFVNDLGLSLFRIRFISKTTPSPKLYKDEHFIQVHDEYYLYIPVDVRVEAV